MIDATYGRPVAGSIDATRQRGRMGRERASSSRYVDRVRYTNRVTMLCGDGRDWARTSDPQLVELGARRSTMPCHGIVGHDLGHAYRDRAGVRLNRGGVDLGVRPLDDVVAEVAGEARARLLAPPA
jgi:hypothetical protein